MQCSSARELSLRSRIDCLPVRCSHSDRGCAWKGQLQQLREHIKNECAIVECKFGVFGCGRCCERKTNKGSVGAEGEAAEGAEERKEMNEWVAADAMSPSPSTPHGSSSLSSSSSSSSLLPSFTSSSHTSLHLDLLHRQVLSLAELVETLSENVRVAHTLATPAFERAQAALQNQIVLSRDSRAMQEALRQQQQVVQQIVHRIEGAALAVAAAAPQGAAAGAGEAIDNGPGRELAQQLAALRIQRGQQGVAAAAEGAQQQQEGIPDRLEQLLEEEGQRRLAAEEARRQRQRSIIRMQKLETVLNIAVAIVGVVVIGVRVWNTWNEKNAKRNPGMRGGLSSLLPSSSSSSSSDSSLSAWNPFASSPSRPSILDSDSPADMIGDAVSSSATQGWNAISTLAERVKQNWHR